MTVSDPQIEGVLLTPLRRIAHPKGDILHGLKCAEVSFAGFGEAYFTSILGGETKGWKKHERMVMNLIVPVGHVLLAVHCDRQSLTDFFALGPEVNYARLTIPPGLWVAFKGCAHPKSLVLNVASIMHEPSESIDVPLDTFAWE